MLEQKRFLIRLLILLALLEVSAFLGGAAPIAGAAAFSLWEVLASPALRVSRKIILASLPLLGVSSLLWASPFGSQIFIGIILFLFFWVHNAKFSSPEAENVDMSKLPSELGTFLYLFVLAINFFVVRAEIFSFLGLPLLVAAALSFSAIREHQKTLLAAMVFTFLFVEILLIGSFLPSSHIVLSVIMVMLYVFSSDLLKRAEERGLEPREVWIRTGALALFILLLLISSGLRPR